MATKAAASLPTDRLEAELETLGASKRAIKEREVEINTELAFRREIALMSEPTRRIIELRLGGEIAPSGTTATGGKE